MNDDPTRGRSPSSSTAPAEVCGVCGGNRRIGNSFGLTTTCPSCHGSGRKLETVGFHDVTKTKASHHRGPASKEPAAAKPSGPTTHEGTKLAAQVTSSTLCTPEVKARLIREIADHEGTHGTCTQTFIKKVLKQVGPRRTP